MPLQIFILRYKQISSIGEYYRQETKIKLKKDGRFLEIVDNFYPPNVHRGNFVCLFLVPHVLYPSLLTDQAQEDGTKNAVHVLYLRLCILFRVGAFHLHDPQRDERIFIWKSHYLRYPGVSTVNHTLQGLKHRPLKMSSYHLLGSWLNSD